MTHAKNTLVALMKNYANYNLWATRTLVNWLRTKPEEVVEQEVPSSFSSILQTLTHILQTQQYWLAIIRKNTSFIPEPFTGSLNELYFTLVEQSAELAEQIYNMTDAEIEDTTHIQSLWFECDFPHFEYLMQVVNHTTYHRGQIITIGRNLGFTDAPMTDYNYYNIYGKVRPAVLV